jgi:hypothetical protein
MAQKTSTVSPINPQEVLPQSASPQEIIAAVQAMPETAIEVPKEVANKAHDFASRRAERNKTVVNKVRLITEINEALESVVKLAETGMANEAEAIEKSGSAALKLYQGWTSGALDAPQVTEILGRKFGAKKKGESKTRVNWASGKDASTTPYGMGETIRKRVVRAVRAAEFVRSNGTEGVAFFDTLSVEDVSPIVEAADKGELPLFTLYDKLAELKTAANEGTRPVMAFDPARVVKMTDKLRENISVTLQTIGGNETLFNTYADLNDLLNLIFDELGVKKAA